MKLTQTSHSFVTLVPSHPLDHLWTPAGHRTRHERIRGLSAAEVDVLTMESGGYRFVEARTGSELRWYAPGNYGFWRNHARLQMHHAASEWVDAESNEHVILLQECVVGGGRPG